MYEKIVSYFERNLCIENIYFRSNFKLWIFGIIAMIAIELLLNYVVYGIIKNVIIRILIILILDCIITGVFLFFIYVVPFKKIYNKKVKIKTSLDTIGLLMKEERLSAYREIEIEEMDNFLRKTCKIKNVEVLDDIIKMIDEEIQNKYEKKNFMDKYFNNTVVPILILILTVYFTNNNEQQLVNIVALTIVSIVTIIIAIKLLTKIKNIKIFPVDKKENLLELKRVLNDIKIKWKSRKSDI